MIKTIMEWIRGTNAAEPKTPAVSFPEMTFPTRRIELWDNDFPADALFPKICPPNATIIIEIKIGSPLNTITWPAFIRCGKDGIHNLASTGGVTTFKFNTPKGDGIWYLENL